MEDIFIDIEVGEKPIEIEFSTNELIQFDLDQLLTEESICHITVNDIDLEYDIDTIDKLEEDLEELDDIDGSEDLDFLEDMDLDFDEPFSLE